MKKLYAMILVGLAVGAMAAPNGYFKQNSDGTIDVVATEAELVTLTVSGTASIPAVTTTGINVKTAGTASLTNGATLTPTSSVMILTGIGGANDTTNTVTLANASAGQELTLIVSGTSTNLITIADSGNALLSSAWVGDNNDSITLYGVSTNWVQLSESDN